MDDTDGDLSNAIEVEGEDFDSNVPGIYKITYNVTDAAGNKAVEVEREVVVEDSVQPEPDTTAPVITLNGDAIVKLSLDEEYTDAGATATDDTDGDLTAKIVTTGVEVDTSIAGSYQVKYNVSDAAGNVASEVVRTVIVEDGQEPESDTTAPVITLLGPASLTIQISDDYADAGATASDDTDGDVTDKITVTGDDFDTNIAGTYTVKYNVSDAAGNAATEVTRTVTVEAAEGGGEPVITGITLSISGSDLTVTPTASGTYDHWHVSLDQPLSSTGAAGGSMVYSDSYTLSSVAPGEHTIYVGLVDASHALLGNAFSRVFNMANVSSQLAVTYGSTFEGADGWFWGSNSAGTKFDVSNKGLLSLGFFNSGFDVEAESQAGNLNNVLANYNILHSDSFSAAPAPGFLPQEAVYPKTDQGRPPYLFVFAGVDDVADIATATEHGLFTSSSFAVIPDGASPVPVDYAL